MEEPLISLRPGLCRRATCRGSEDVKQSYLELGGATHDLVDSLFALEASCAWRSLSRPWIH